MAGELCAVLLQAVYLTLDGTTVIGVFLSMCFFIYFTCNPIASSLCHTKQQQPPILYQLETVPVPIIDQNTKAHLYTQLQVMKPFIALNSETYISLQQQELRSCKRIGYEFYCEELFVVKHKSRYSCESVICFNLNTDTIKENHNFIFYYNKTDISGTVLDGGNEICQTINTLSATLAMTYQSEFLVIHMF